MSDREFWVVEHQGIPQQGHPDKAYADQFGEEDFGAGEFSTVRYVPAEEPQAKGSGDGWVAADEHYALKARLLELEGRINTPHTDDWFEAVRLEAAHQVERWGAEHDAGKGPQDWFWLLGYLGGKALASAIKGDVEKAKHHTISSGALLLNWFRRMTGESTAMRPGIAPPPGADQ